MKIIEENESENGLDIDDLFETANYDRTSLENDFQHIRHVHDRNVDDIVRGIRKEVHCQHTDDCDTASRGRGSVSMARGLMDKIHSYFLQFGILCVLCHHLSVNDSWNGFSHQSLR